MQAQRLPARQGLVWVIAGFRLFRANPPLLTLIAFAYLLILTFMLILPFGLGGVLFPLLQPTLMLAIANGCRGVATQSRGGPAPDFAAGIRNRQRPLLQLGALQLLGSLLVIMFTVLIGQMPDPKKPTDMLPFLALVAALSSPLLLAFWFAPLLTGWDGVPALKSTFFSLVAGLRNWRAFIVYALVLSAITVIPALLVQFALQVSANFGQFLLKIMEALTLVLLLPVFLASSYVSYRDVFLAAPPPTTPANE